MNWKPQDKLYVNPYGWNSHPSSRKDEVEYIRKDAIPVMTWEDIALIIAIYEKEVQEGNIDKYGDADKVKPYSELILNKYKELTASTNKCCC